MGCFICGMQLKNRNNLPHHMKTHEKEAAKEDDAPNTIQFHPDSEFEDVTNDPRRLSKSWHYFLHNGKTNEAKCRYCGYLIPSKGTGDMIAHLKRKHKIIVETMSRSNDPERWKCKYCGKIFKEGSAYRDHINTHTGERPHVCKFCGKTFASSGNMHAHIRQGHLGKKRNSSERKSHMNSSQESKALHQLPLPLGLENLSQMKNNTNNSTPQYRQVK